MNSNRSTPYFEDSIDFGCEVRVAIFFDDDDDKFLISSCLKFVVPCRVESLPRNIIALRCSNHDGRLLKRQEGDETSMKEPQRSLEQSLLKIMNSARGDWKTALSILTRFVVPLHGNFAETAVASIRRSPTLSSEVLSCVQTIRRTIKRREDIRTEFNRE